MKLSDALYEIWDMCSKVGLLPHMTEETRELYKQLLAEVREVEKEKDFNGTEVTDNE